MSIRSDLPLASETLSRAAEHGHLLSPVKDATSPQELVERSRLAFAAGRFQECVDAARKALDLNPNIAEAYNNIAVGDIGLGKLDEAVEAAQQALRIKPDFVLARNNLAWAQSEKQKAAGGAK